jgi:peptide/nickel transport system permease protein
MMREILPNISGPLLVDACVRMSYALFATGALGFLGLGVPPPFPDWGQMINDGRAVVMMTPWAPLWPMFALISVVIALNMIADGMRQAGWVD